MQEQLRKLKEKGYRFIYFASDPEQEWSNEAGRFVARPPYAWAVDFCWPGDDVVTIDAAIADPEKLLRGRELRAA